MVMAAPAGSGVTMTTTRHGQHAGEPGEKPWPFGIMIFDFPVTGGPAVTGWRTFNAADQRVTALRAGLH